LLAWTDQHSDHAEDHINADGFAASTHGWFEGGRFTWPEIVSAAQFLRGADLVNGLFIKTSVGIARVDVAITDAGHECVDDFDGEPGAYMAAKQPKSAPTFRFGDVNNSAFAITGDRSTATAHQTTNVDSKSAALLAAALRQAMPTLNLSPLDLSQEE
jgi:hypothetical protein